MTTIDRTAYPVLDKAIGNDELAACYELGTKERIFITQNARNDRGYLVLATMLKTRQHLGYFISLDQVPKNIINHLSGQLDVEIGVWKINDDHIKKTLYRYRSSCRKFLESASYTDEGERRIIHYIRKAALTMSDPADLINVAIEELSAANIELPAFSTLDRIASHARHQVHNELYAQITRKLDANQLQILNSLLVVQKDKRITEFARMKQTPGPATLKHFRAWANRLIELDSVMNTKPFFEGIAHTKIRQFSAEARAYEISDIRGINNEAKQHTLLLSLLYRGQLTIRVKIGHICWQYVR